MLLKRFQIQVQGTDMGIMHLKGKLRVNRLIPDLEPVIDDVILFDHLDLDILHLTRR